MEKEIRRSSKNEILTNGIRERGDSQYQVMIRMKNRATNLLHEESRTFETLREAKDWQAEMQVFLKKGIHNDTRLIDKTPLSVLIEKYRDEESLKKGGSEQEVDRMNRWLNDEKCKHISEMMLSKVTTQVLSEYVSKRRKDASRKGGLIKEQTIKHEILALSVVFEKAYEWGYDLPNPTKRLGKIGGSETIDVRIHPSDWTALRDALAKRRNKQYVLISEFAIETGLRSDELFRMTWAEIDLEKKQQTVWGKDTTTRVGKRKKRIVPLSERAIEILMSLTKPKKEEETTKNVWQVARCTGADGLSRAFTKDCKTAGIVGGHFHCTRHEAASRLAPFYDILTLMKIFGWETPKMALRYYHADADVLAAGLSKKAQADAEKQAKQANGA